MDAVREMERRKKNRYTYNTTSRRLRALKLAATEMDIKINELLDAAVDEYINAHFAGKKKEFILNGKNSVQ